MHISHILCLCRCVNKLGGSMSVVMQRVLSPGKRSWKSFFGLFPKIPAGLDQCHLEPCSDTEILPEIVVG